MAQFVTSAVRPGRALDARGRSHFTIGTIVSIPWAVGAL